MLQDKKSREVLTKAYEISYALSRVGANSPEPSLKDALLKQAFALLEAAASRNYPQANVGTIGIEYLVKFGGDTGLIHRDNVETLVLQVRDLRAIVEVPGESTALAAVPLGDIFAASAPRVMHVEKPAKQEDPEIAEVTEPPEANESGNAAMRQSAILEKIRQSGNCRLKDIQEILPELSERTIRYDLQSLLERNLIERVGNGGPSVYYRAR